MKRERLRKEDRRDEEFEKRKEGNESKLKRGCFVGCLFDSCNYKKREKREK